MIIEFFLASSLIFDTTFPLIGSASDLSLQKNTPVISSGKQTI